MIDWSNITDEEMRAEVVSDIESTRAEWITRAQHDETDLRNHHLTYDEAHQERLTTRARMARRQAAHYQQAIDLLTAAPMLDPA